MKRHLFLAIAVAVALALAPQPAIAGAAPVAAVPRSAGLAVSAQAAAPSPDPGTLFVTMLSAYREAVSPGSRYELAETQSVGDWAYAVAYQLDSEGRIIPYQFMVLLGRNMKGQGWSGVMPGLHAAAMYNAFLEQFPDRVMDESMKAYLHQATPWEGETSLTGHKLPWPARQIATVTKKDGSQHESQVDFDIHGSRASGDVYASKPGTVVFVKENSSSGACSFSNWRQANMAVVQHGPSEYSWYVHLAPGSVPFVVGDSIDFGSKVGVEGNTGYSCGVHLHYMSSTGHTTWTDPADPGAAPWATGITAVDFDEVAWAGLTVGQTYTSQNEIPVQPYRALLPAVGKDGAEALPSQ